MRTEQRLRNELRDTRAALVNALRMLLLYDERRKRRGVRRWRKATDIAVNLILKELGVSPGTPYAPRFTGLTAEQIYRVLEREEKAIRKGPWQSL